MWWNDGEVVLGGDETRDFPDILTFIMDYFFSKQRTGGYDDEGLRSYKHMVWYVQRW
jgi:hypothetical protein